MRAAKQRWWWPERWRQSVHRFRSFNRRLKNYQLSRAHVCAQTSIRAQTCYTSASRQLSDVDQQGETAAQGEMPLKKQTSFVDIDCMCTLQRI